MDVFVNLRLLKKWADTVGAKMTPFSSKVIQQCEQHND